MPKKSIDAEALKHIRQNLSENKKSAEVETQVQTEWLGQAFSLTRIIRWKKPAPDQAAIPEVGHTVLSDEPTNFLGTDAAPKPTELALAALGSCLIVGVVYHAALMGLRLDEVKISLTGSLSRTGLLDLDQENRPGFRWIKVELHIEAPHPRESIEKLKDVVIRTSPVLDMLQNPVDVHVHLS